MSRLREHAGLLVILAAFCVLGTLYLWTTPLLETPDEPSHFAVVKYIADEGRLPPANPAPPDAGPVPVILPGPPVYYAPPLYYLLGAPLIADLDTDGFAEAVIPNPNWARGWAPTPGRAPENKHIYVHTADHRFPPDRGTGWAVAMVRLRIFSLLLGGATVAGVYALARLTVPPTGRTNQPCWALAATALVAFNPAFLFVTSGVTNDALLCALSTWAFVLMARLLRNPRRQPAGASQPAHDTPPAPGPAVLLRAPHGAGYVALLGAVLGLAALTKQSALILLPVAALAVVWGARARSQSWRVAFSWLLLCAILVALLDGWWYLHNTLTYGDPLGFQPHQPPTEAWQPPLSLITRQLGQALRGYWGAFGWGLILVDPSIYILVAAFVLPGLLGWLRRISNPAATLGLRPPSQVVTTLALGVLLNLIGLLLWLWRTSAPYGRLLYPTIGPLAVILVLGWQRWLGPRLGRLFAWSVALIFGLYAVVVPWRYLRPAYASPIVSPSIVEHATPLDVQFDAKLRLLGYRVTPQTARPGDRVVLTLYWQATASLEQDATVFVQLAPQDPQQRVAGLDDYVGGSRYPTSVWQVGEVIEQAHQLRLPDDALALRSEPVAGPALYWFNVGLYDEPGSERWPGTADGAPLPDRAVRLGPLRVFSAETSSPGHKVDYRLGAAIRLTGYNVDVSHATAVTVTLYWQAVAAPGEDLSVFVHLLDGQGRAVAQHDGAPRQGDYPTWAWQPGERVPDSHALLLPADLLPATYFIRVGLCRSGDGTRIAVFDAAGRPLPDDVVPLTKLSLPDENNRHEH